MDLVEFLLARIAEDEAAAQAGTGGPWKLGGLDPQEIGDGWFLQPADKQHLWRWYPDRVLAECEAKRRIVEGMKPYGPIDDINATEVLPLLALPYADHPDYREEWRPW